MGKKKNNFYFFYFKRSLFFLITFKPVIYVHLLLEYIDVYSNLIDMSSQLFYYNDSYTPKENNQISKYLLKLSPFEHLFTLFTKETAKDNISSNGQILLIVCAGFFSFFCLALWTIRNIKPEKISWLTKLLNILLVNFYDYLFFRTLAIWSINAIIQNLIGYATWSTFTAVDLLILFIVFLLFFLMIFVNTTLFSTFCIWSTFKMESEYFRSYPFDSSLSKNYDIVMLIEKILVTFSKNHLLIQGYVVDVIQLFLNIAALSVAIVMSVWIIYSFTLNSRNLPFWIVSNDNGFRWLLSIFLSSSIMLRLMFNNDNYSIFFTFSLLSLLSECVIVYCYYKKYSLMNVEKSSNYLGVIWYWQNNEVDTNSFITQWMINHKLQCNDNSCDWCQEEKQNISLDNKSNQQTSQSLSKMIKCSTLINTINWNSTIIKSFDQKPQEENAKWIADNSDSKLNNSITEHYSAYKFNTTLLQKIYKNRNGLSNDEWIRLDLLFISVLFISKTNQRFKLFTSISKWKQKYKDNQSVLISILLIFEIIWKSDQETVKSYKWIRKSEDLRGLVVKYIKDFETFLHYEMKTPINFLKISDKFAQWKDNSKMLQSVLRKDSEFNYQLLLIRYAFEAILHEKLKNLSSEFDIHNYENFLEFHFGKDKWFLLRYSIDRGVFTIVKGSKEIMKYKNKAFESIFPEYVKAKGIQNFVSQLKNNEDSHYKQIFSFVTKDLTEDETYGYIQAFKMKYEVYPSNKESEMWIQVSYIVNHTNVIIFEILHSNGEENLFSISNGLRKYLGWTPEMIQILYKSGNYINFNEIFPSQPVIVRKGISLCTFQYQRYSQFLKNMLKNELLNDCLGFEDSKRILDDMNKKGKGNAEIQFLLIEKYEYVNAKSKFMIYQITEKPKKGLNKSIIKTIDNQNDLASDESFNENKEMLVPMFNNNTPIQNVAPTVSAAYSCASVSVSSNNMRYGASIQAKKIMKDKEKKMQYKHIQIFTFCILWLGCFLMLLTLVFWVLEINKNNDFQNMITLFQKFKKFKRGIDAIPLSIVSNLCYYDSGAKGNTDNDVESDQDTNIKCHRLFENYSIQMQSTYQELSSFPLISEIIAAEIPSKYESASQSLNDFVTDINKWNSKTISDWLSKIIDVTNIINDHSTIEIQIKKVTFIDTIRAYNTYLTTIISEKAYWTELTYFFSFENDRKNIRIANPESLPTWSQVQRSIMLMIWNYPTIHTSVSYSNKVIMNEFSNYLLDIRYILIGFTTSWLFWHGVLGVICLYFLEIFVKMLKTIIQSSLFMFNSKTFIEFIGKRMSCLRVWIEWYEDAPLKVVASIETYALDYKKHFKDYMNKKDKKETEGLQPESAPNETNKIEFNELGGTTNKGNLHNIMISRKEFDEVINTYFIVISTLFSVYIIYSIVFFIFLILANNDLRTLITYCDVQTKIDNYIFDTINSIEYLIVTNSSTYDWGNVINGDPTLDYLNYGIEDFYQAVTQKEEMEYQYSNLFPPFYEIENWNCSEVVIDDNLMESAMTAWDREGKYPEFLKAICRIFPISTYGNDNMILKELLYLNNQWRNKFKQTTSFETMVDQLDNKEIFNIITMVVTFNRVLRSHFNANIFSKEVNNIVGNFSVLIIIYWVMNMFLEVIIFWILNFMVILRIKDKNQKLEKFITALRFT